jgi:murein L,D-transpeptidase YafK
MPYDTPRIQRLPPPGHPRRAATGTGSANLYVTAALALLFAITLGGCGGGTTTTPDHVDRVLVKKSQRKLQLLDHQGKVLREYHVALGDNPRGHKMREGDEATPVGDYVLDWRNPRSQYHKSIHVSYPNERDRQLAKLLGVNPGGMIMVHGLPNEIQSPTIRAEYLRRDWTNGCIAVQDHEIDEIWRMVRDGTPIRIQE